MRNALPLLASCLLLSSPVYGEEPRHWTAPVDKEGVLEVPFLPNEKLSLRMDREHYVFLTRVESLGTTPKKTEDTPSPTRPGILVVTKVLFSPADGCDVRGVKKLSTGGCEKLKIGDHVIVFVGGGPDFAGLDGIASIACHAGTSSKLGVNLGKPDANGRYSAEEERFMELLKPETLPIREMPEADFSIWKKFDPVGAAEEQDLIDFQKGKVAR
ncbi:hypothetical protein [Luteolibacter sp. LG18]|uniref:hypothetical protein n=1 Tax=Luteolibacter sp. LG18 TaxID=2819286 RepID=UPI002B30FE40|nr:hypothetical protein llg_29800 [Luteolibacter sp. LG18]